MTHPKSIQQIDLGGGGARQPGSRTVPEGDLKAFFDFVVSAEGQAVVARHFVSLRDGR